MNRIWLVLAAVLLVGCGVQPSGVTDGGEAPTGLAPGVTLYFVDADEQLTPEPRPSQRLGTIEDALSLLMSGTSNSPLHTEIRASSVPRVNVTRSPGLIQLDVPLSIYEVTPLGIDQIVCTALAVHVQSGGPRDTRVQVRFTLPTAESAKLRTCPLIKAS
ncbi:hypothetical protein ALI144C_16775 [Actinosynnema sp. ALI-1.44]|uniref:hypothetical protein n=1 Tax=Actinosynnema sp. ALI-1.44 TaxID=1933779 RepID=UPI00097BDE3D|nr:hypothetical protein [Actinosynnema sp. ALI-1.44]ONI83156.1 hypothetical protein ALI144C_16775 [Actinosynnema sp. ALI-1.44]